VQWASSISTAAHLHSALREVAADVRRQLGRQEAGLAVVFVSAHHAAQFDRVPDLLAADFPAALVVGCSAGGVIGAGREIEASPGVSLTAAVLPGVDIVPFHIADDVALPDSGEARAWEKLLGVAAAETPHFLILPDPFGFDAEALLRALDLLYPGSAVFGGMASGARQPGDNALFLSGRVYRSGLVGVALSGNIAVDTVVAQGCRPIGLPMFVTRCQGNVVWELDGRPAVEVLKDVYTTLTRADQDLARHSLFVGIVMRDQQQEYRHGDFLIRNLVGMDGERGAIAVGAIMHEGAVVQFHLRDARTSTNDLEHMLGDYSVPAGTPPGGALLFSCLGRGAGLYGEPDHDSNIFHRLIGDIPLGGFFCNGEIGPVQGVTFLHGYTSSFALFRSRWSS
jgi:small ligand-binding sensory domain FIST